MRKNERHSFIILATCCLALVLFLLMCIAETTIVESDQVSEDICVENTGVTSEQANPTLKATYTYLGVPNINSSFKSWMGHHHTTDKNSNQYKFIHKWGWTDSEGFMRCNGERDLGITDDYYLIALGSYYGTTIGTKYRITLDTGNVFYGVLAECKANIHTNSTNQYVVSNKSIIEFVVEEKLLNGQVKYDGTANVYMPLNGSVKSIERIDFIME